MSRRTKPTPVEHLLSPPAANAWAAESPQEKLDANSRALQALVAAEAEEEDLRLELRDKSAEVKRLQARLRQTGLENADKERFSLLAFAAQRAQAAEQEARAKAEAKAKQQRRRQAAAARVSTEGPPELSNGQPYAHAIREAVALEKCDLGPDDAEIVETKPDGAKVAAGRIVMDRPGDFCKLHPPAKPKKDPKANGQVLEGKPDGAKVPTCRECGCTEHHACVGGCSWVQPDLCSRCAYQPKTLVGVVFDGDVAQTLKEAKFTTLFSISSWKAGRLDPHVRGKHFAEITGLDEDDARKVLRQVDSWEFQYDWPEAGLAKPKATRQPQPAAPRRRKGGFAPTQLSGVKQGARHAPGTG